MPDQPSTHSRQSVGVRTHRLPFAFHTPGFQVLWGAALCSQVGLGTQQVLRGWLVLSMTDSSSMVGVLFAVRSAPNLLVGFAAGAITDRLDRRMLMRLTVCGMALVSWLIAWLWWMGHLHIWQLLLCAGLFGLLQESMWQNVGAYGQEPGSNRVMQSLMLSTAGAELLGFSHQVMLPILAKDVLHSSATGLGMLTAARSLGGVLGSGLLTALQPMRHRGALLLATLVLFGSGQVMLAHAPYFWLAVVCVMFVNTMAAATDILH